MAGLIARMNRHFNSCILDPIFKKMIHLEKIMEVTTESGKEQATDLYINANKRHATIANLNKFIVKASKHDKGILYVQVICFIYATNPSFSCVNH